VPIITASALVLPAGGLAACGSVTERSDTATEAAVRFLAAASEGDGSGACALLAPGTHEELEHDSGVPCARAVAEQELPEPEPVTAVDVYGQWAVVRLGEQALFLAVFPGGWRVVAAGCRPRGERPYECVVDGGG
jgi:hypothetical protein